MKFNSSEEDYQGEDSEDEPEEEEEEEIEKAPSIPSEKPEEKKEIVPEKTFQRKNRKLVLDSEDEEEAPKKEPSQEIAQEIPDEKKEETKEIKETKEITETRPQMQIEEAKENPPSQMQIEEAPQESSNRNEVVLTRTLSRDILGRRSRQLANSAVNPQRQIRLTRNNRLTQQMETEEVVEETMCSRCG